MENRPEKRRYHGLNTTEIITAALFAAALILFAYWVFTGEKKSVQGLVAASVSLGLFTLALALAVPKAIRFFMGEESAAIRSIGVRSERKEGVGPFIRVVLAALAAHVLIIVIAYVYALVFRGVHGSVFTTMEEIWVKPDTDARHYFSIAENGYTTDPIGKYTLVFLPLFPLVIRAFNFIFHDSFVSAMVINTICTSLAAGVIYRLALCDMGRRSARLAVLFALALPAAIFFTAPMSEALFVLLCASCLLALRKDKFWLAGIFGALASFTRSPGILLLAPFIAEGVNYCVRRCREKGREKLWLTVVKLVVCAMILFSGTFCYLLINKLLWNNWFQFTIFQKENWYQQAGLFFATSATQTDYLFAEIGADRFLVMGLWLPNLLFELGALLVFIFTARTLRTSYTLFFAAYYAVCCGATWLLSAPRYLTALVVIPLALAHLCDSRNDGVALGRARIKAASVGIVLIVCQLIYLYMYVFRGAAGEMYYIY